MLPASVSSVTTGGPSASDAGESGAAPHTPGVDGASGDQDVRSAGAGAPTTDGIAPEESSKGDVDSDSSKAESAVDVSGSTQEPPPVDTGVDTAVVVGFTVSSVLAALAVMVFVFFCCLAVRRRRQAQHSPPGCASGASAERPGHGHSRKAKVCATSPVLTLMCVAGLLFWFMPVFRNVLLGLLWCFSRIEPVETVGPLSPQCHATNVPGFGAMRD